MTAMARSLVCQSVEALPRDPSALETPEPGRPCARGCRPVSRSMAEELDLARHAGSHRSGRCRLTRESLRLPHGDPRAGSPRSSRIRMSSTGNGTASGLVPEAAAGCNASRASLGCAVRIQQAYPFSHAADREGQPKGGRAAHATLSECHSNHLVRTGEPHLPADLSPGRSLLWDLNSNLQDDVLR